ncbi:hypothetical protein [Flavobacterium sp.]|uniref:hypothetical protein n=1 Tax=Flavobacterium sp. TaxID=239 RepID=UPI004034F43D
MIENNIKDTAGGFLNFLIQSLVAMANDPANKRYYLPIFLKDLKVDGDKTLVPYVTEINMGGIESIKSQVSETLCNAAWASLEGYDGAHAFTVPVINISSVSINGLNNALISSYRVYPANAQMQYAVVFSAKMNAYPDLGDLTFDPAKFYFDVTCQSDDNLHKEDIHSDGNFKGSVGKANFNGVLLISLNDDLTTTVTVPESYAPEGSGTMAGLSIVFAEGDGLVVTDITLEGDDPLKEPNEEAINQAFSNDDTLKKIEVLFNESINKQSVRETLASGMQGKLNDLINDLK